MQNEISYQELVQFLRGVAGFREIDPTVIETRIIPMLSVVTYQTGDQILRRNHDNGTLYLLRDGQIRVEVPTAGEPRPVILKAGAILGEMSLVSNKPAAANVFAHTDATLLTLDVETFRDLMQENVEMTRSFAFMIGQRIADFVKLRK
ncbi:MAG: cyclic nucleotide-binding domain-containing protein [Magnetococcales bacterium]|nr:cyclic nucleotide-binding domain-containing protein [Magnetococcales bacterium]